MLGQFPSLKMKKALFHHLHLTSSWGGLFTILAHMILLLGDSYQPYTIKEIILPFSSSYEPIESGIGTIAFILILLVMILSDLWRKGLKGPLWRKIHFLVFPAWVGMLVHGILIGTDSSNPLIIAFYGGALAVVSSLFILKIIETSTSAKKQMKQ